jgi:hypothetical protein
LKSTSARNKGKGHALRLDFECKELRHENFTDSSAVGIDRLDDGRHDRLSPQQQYVLTLSGTLGFTTRDGETFVLRRATSWSLPTTQAVDTTGA